MWTRLGHGGEEGVFWFGGILPRSTSSRDLDPCEGLDILCIRLTASKASVFLKASSFFFAFHQNSLQETLPKMLGT